MKGADDWADSGLKMKSVQKNAGQIFEQSIIRDIFGGVFQTTLQIDGTKEIKTQHEPFFVLNLEIPYS